MKKKIFTSGEIIQLHSVMPGFWLLLEILQYDKWGKAKLLKMISFSSDKNELLELLMEDEDWCWDKKYIFVYTDSDSCEIKN
ncbi:MAG: hypothetical protein V3V00_02425 [Saprospiraceae bacterium]